ncbi:MAG TPA: Asp-tRNA(Asn)/Glu-tRNA(Gln) amidotransferase GatCAB subunit B [Planctomycetes bacterium]|nr:Asp-tRNA(Asn)/Glu-tRNA(Gln) amidotransferase GatCAB subunit B [Planctomycetota bacterium]
MTLPPGVKATLVVGLEIHVQLRTATKLFCGCEVRFGAPPNSLTCPVCLGHPGTLPVMNREALRCAVKTAMALGCRVLPRTKWDRKSYWYPDLPKNYQISQYDLPVGLEGAIEIPRGDGTAKTVRIRRVHLEEDAGKNLHDDPEVTLVDLNRTGTPLLEIVTEPDIASAEEAGALARELQRIVRYMGVADADMQKGHMRFEPNINCIIEKDGAEARTPIVEVKNLNSFKALEAAVAFEFERQAAAYLADPAYTIERCGKENRGWDDAALRTLVQRHKEEAHEYRYFPDPDLVPYEWTAEELGELAREAPELPQARRRRLARELGIGEGDALLIVEDRATGDLFEAAVAAGTCPKTLAKHFINIWTRLANDAGVAIAGLGLGAGALAELARIQADGTVSATAAQQIAEAMAKSPEPPRALAARMGLLQLSDRAAILPFVKDAIAANAKAAADYRAGGKKSAKSLGFLQGQAMRLSGGRANPAVIAALLKEELGPPAG